MKQRVDYSDFRLSQINAPQYAHLKLLLGWIVYFIAYFLTENLIPEEACHVIHCRLDDVIPFREEFVLAYCIWYVLTAGSLLYFLLYDVERFKQLQTFIIITQVVAVILYIVYPSRQELRPEVFPRDNVFTAVIGWIYAFDTPTGVCPSLHVAYSMGIASVWLKDKDVPRWWRAGVLALVILICLSTLFIKQHSVVDLLVAIPVSVLAEGIVFRHRYRLTRFLTLQHQKKKTFGKGV